MQRDSHDNDEYQFLEDSDSMIYHPKRHTDSFDHIITTGCRSSASTSIASSIDSVASDRNESKKKPVRPPPPAPSSSNDDQLIKSEEANDPPLIDITDNSFPDPVLNTSVFDNQLAAVGIKSSGRRPPPPVPPRNLDGFTSV